MRLGLHHPDQGDLVIMLLLAALLFGSGLYAYTQLKAKAAQPPRPAAASPR